MSLLCAHHHQMVNHRRLAPEQRPDGTWIAHPPPRPDPVYGPAVYQAPAQPP